MKRSVIAALGAVVIVTLGASSAAEAGTIDFGVLALSDSIIYSGTSLEVSTALDLDLAIFLVTSASSGDESGLAPFVSTVNLSAATSPVSTEIIYGPGTGPGPLGADVTVSWGAFTETFTTVKAVARNPNIPDSIGVELTGTLTGPSGSGFVDTPVSLVLTANQAGGPGGTTSASFTNSTSISGIPEPSIWVMMALGFGALGYAGFRRRKANVATPSA
jgi:PEP-CTERM motif